MKLFIVFAAVVLTVNAATDSEAWLKFKKTHKRDYKDEREEQLRFSIFQKNLRTIEAHNEKHQKAETSYYMGINQFADMSPEEFRNMLNYSRLAKPSVKSGKPYQPSKEVLASEVDWVQRGAVTPIKNQGNCGACWAFSTTGSLEGQYYLGTGNIVSLSEQNLVDCSVGYGNQGCNGGVMDYAFQYIQDYGIELESDYPYTGYDGYCMASPSLSFLRVSGWYDIPYGDENALQNAVANAGPIAVAVDANDFQFYAGGIFDDSGCSHELNHGVLVVGYGEASGYDYWLVKNSWGVTWGENGYIRMVRNMNDQCGIADEASYPVI